MVSCEQHSPYYPDYHYDSILAGSRPDTKVKTIILNAQALLGQLTVTEIVRRGDVISTVFRLMLYILCVDVRPSLKKEFPEDQYETFNSVDKVITYLRDIIQSGSSSVNRTKRSRLFITGHQGCGKSSLIHYLR